MFVREIKPPYIIYNVCVRKSMHIIAPQSYRLKTTIQKIFLAALYICFQIIKQRISTLHFLLL